MNNENLNEETILLLVAKDTIESISFDKCDLKGALLLVLKLRDQKVTTYYVPFRSVQYIIPQFKTEQFIQFQMINYK